MNFDVEFGSTKIVDTSTGQMTPCGGEIFNDYENNRALGEHSTAFGTNATAGQKAFYIHSIDVDVKRIILSEATEKPNIPIMGSGLVDDSDSSVSIGYEPNDVFSITNDAHYDFCGKIARVEGNAIYYQGDLPFDSIVSGTDHDDHTFFVPSKARIGLVNITPGNFASGLNSISAGKGSFATGIDTIAGGNASFTAGRRTKAGYIATATGLDTSALGNYSNAEGRLTQATGEYSKAQNCATKASGESSVAMNAITVASGNAAVATGRETEASGWFSFTSGWKTKASGTCAIATGNETEATGEDSIATGHGTKANGSCSSASGIGTIADGTATHVGGKFNRTSGNKIVVYGNGTNDNNRKDAYSLDWNGNGEYSGHVNTKYVKEDCFDNGKTTSLSGIKDFDGFVEPGHYHFVWYHKNDGGEEEITCWNITVSVKKVNGTITRVFQIREAYGQNTGKEYWKQTRFGELSGNGSIGWSDWVDLTK